MQDNRIKGISYMLVSGFAFALMSASVKAVGDLPVYEKVLSRNFVSLIAAAIMILVQHRGAPLFGKRQNQGLLLSRSLLGLAGVYLLFGAISAGLPLTDANILSRLNPAFVTLFACLFLKEKIPSLHVPLLIVIFGCAALVIKPTFDLSVLPALAATGTAVCSGMTYTILRYLKGREEPATIVFYFSLISVLAMLIPTLTHFVMPSPMQLVWLLCIGLSASVGQFGLTFAYKYAKAAEVSIYSYSTILFALLLDVMLWGKVPDAWALIGGAGIILSALILYLQNRRAELAHNKQ
jgi:drug/metabolite transporter (DMT)-like permease